MEEIKIGVWSKKSKNGFDYYGGKTQINGVDYFVTVFDNRENKKNEKAPDFNIILKKVEKQVVISEEDEGLPFI